MTTQAAEVASAGRGWSAKLPHVRAVLTRIKAGKITEPAQLVEWDRTHGKRLLDWDNRVAAEAWRMQQARDFFRSFQATIDGIRVRLIKGVRNDSGPGRQYIPTETVSESKPLRDKVVAEIQTRMKRDAAELRIWGYTRAERNRLFSEFDEI